MPSLLRQDDLRRYVPAFHPPRCAGSRDSARELVPARGAAPDCGWAAARSRAPIGCLRRVAGHHRSGHCLGIGPLLYACRHQRRVQRKQAAPSQSVSGSLALGKAGLCPVVDGPDVSMQGYHPLWLFHLSGNCRQLGNERQLKHGSARPPMHLPGSVCHTGSRFETTLIGTGQRQPHPVTHGECPGYRHQVELKAHGTAIGQWPGDPVRTLETVVCRRAGRTGNRAADRQ